MFVELDLVRDLALAGQLASVQKFSQERVGGLASSHLVLTTSP